MNTTIVNATEYRNLPIAVLTESTTNPRRIFEDEALKELAESIRSQGVLSPMLVRPLNERSFEIVAGARRYLDHGTTACMVDRNSSRRLLRAYFSKLG